MVYCLGFTVYCLRFTVYCLPFRVYGLLFTVYCLRFLALRRCSGAGGVLFTVDRLGKATANVKIGRFFEKTKLKLTALIFVTTRPLPSKL